MMTSTYVALLKGAIFTVVLIAAAFSHVRANAVCDFSESTDGNPVWSPTGDNIAFVSDCAGSYDIWLVDPNGDNLRNLTIHGDGYEHNPAWSPDGTLIVYVASEEIVTTTSDIWIVSVIDGMTKNLTGESKGPVEGINMSPVWSPSGNYITFVQLQNNDTDIVSDIWIYDFQNDVFTNLTAESKTLLDFPNAFCFPSWSPDSKQIVTSACGLRENGVWEIDISSESLFNLTSSEAYGVQWSPDGVQLVFHTLPGIEPAEIFLLEKNEDGAEITYLTNGARPRWSPTGDRIAFTNINLDFNVANDRIDVLVIEKNGANVVNLTAEHGYHNSWPEWSPDGEYLVFASDVDGTYDIWLVELNGSKFEKLVG